MRIFLFVLELIGTIAFAVSGAMVGLKKKMDLFGDDAKSLYMLNSEMLGRVYAAPSLVLD